MDAPAVRLMQRLGLTDDELCAVRGVDPIAVITEVLDHRPELGILLALPGAVLAVLADALNGGRRPTW